MNSLTKKISFSAMFAAMVFGLTMLHVPIGAGGYIHIGDAVIYVAALLLGAPWAFIAAAIGAAFADIASGFASYALASVIIKVLIALPFVLIRKKDARLLTVFSALMTLISGAVTVLGYFLADLVLYRAGAVADIPANLVQAVGSAAVFIALAFALDKADIKRRFEKGIQ